MTKCGENGYYRYRGRLPECKKVANITHFYLGFVLQNFSFNSPHMYFDKLCIAISRYLQFPMPVNTRHKPKNSHQVKPIKEKY